MQLNALFCCLWHNVKGSCHKHFVSSLAINTAAYYQRCVMTCDMLAMLHRQPRWQHLPVAALTQAHNRDFCVPRLHSTPPAGRFLSECCCAVWHGQTRMVWLLDGVKISKIFLLVLTWSTNVTDRRTDTAWWHRPRLCIASCGKKLTSVLCV